MNDWNRAHHPTISREGGKGITGFGQTAAPHGQGARAQTRRTPVAYHRDGERYVIAASKGGAPTHPLGTTTSRRPARPTSRSHREVPCPCDPHRERTGARRLYEQHPPTCPGFANT